MADAVRISKILDELGYSTGEARARARAALEEAKLTNPRKTGIAVSKLGEAAEVLGSRFFRYCGSLSCASRNAAGKREPILVPRQDCESCASEFDYLAAEMIQACMRAGIDRILVVGGGPSQRTELRGLLGGYLRVDFVDGEKSVRSKSSRVLARNAGVVAIWVGTIISHSHSEVVTSVAPAHKIVRISQRSVSALMRGVIEHCRRLALTSAA